MTITGAYKKDRTSQPSTQRILFTPLPATQVNVLELHTEILKPTGVTPAGFFDTYLELLI